MNILSIKRNGFFNKALEMWWEVILYVKCGQGGSKQTPLAQELYRRSTAKIHKLDPGVGSWEDQMPRDETECIGPAGSVGKG